MLAEDANTIKMTTWTMFEFASKWRSNQIVKPLIQRKKRWLHAACVAYINFLLQRRRTVLPLLMNERIIAGHKTYILYDGNNRTNAILDFILAPLAFKSEIIPIEFPTELHDLLKEATLEELLKKRLTLRKFIQGKNMISLLPGSDVESVWEEAWDKMIETIAQWEFMDISVSLDVAENLSDKEMREIYEATNMGGTVLTAQEILASSTFEIVFDRHDTEHFQTLHAAIEEYYGEINRNERVQIQGEERTTMNLFEILIALQLVLHHQFDFIQEPFDPSDTSLDLTFKVFEAIHGGFESRPANMGVIIRSMFEGCRLIADIRNTLYDPALPSKKRAHLSKNNLTLFLVYNYWSIQKGESLSTRRETLLRVILFHELCRMLGKTEHPKRALDYLQYHAGGHIIPDKLRRIRETVSFDYVPSADDIHEVLTCVCQKEVRERPYDAANKRKTESAFRALAHTAFFNYQVPSGLKVKKHECDHVVPFSASASCQTPFDICRLGNMQLIPEEINKERGNKPITDVWVEQKGLKYQEYPKQSEYETICVQVPAVGKGKRAGCEIRDIDAFNQMCERREELYMKCIMRHLDCI